MLGNTIYPVKDVIRVLLGEQVKGASFAVGTIRLPRMIAGVFAGFAFGVGGYIFQTMLRNPLANPNVIGITAGSSAAAVFCIIVLQASNTVVSIACRYRWACYSTSHLFFIKRLIVFHWSINFNRDWHSGDVDSGNQLFNANR